MPLQEQRTCGGVTQPIPEPGTRRWVESTMLRPLYPQEVDATDCTVGWVGLVANLEGTENLAPIGVRSP